MLDASVPNDHCQPLQEPCSSRHKGRQPHGVTELESSVAQNLERKVETLGHLALILGGLRAEAEHLVSKVQKFLIVIAKVAGLRRTATGAGDCVPIVGKRFSWHPSHGIAIDDSPKAPVTLQG